MMCVEALPTPIITLLLLLLLLLLRLLEQNESNIQRVLLYQVLCIFAIVQTIGE